MSFDASFLLPLIVTTADAIQSSALFTMAVWFLGFYTIVLFLDVVMLLFLRDISGDLKKTLYGAKRPLLSQSKFQKRWATIETRLGSENASQYKAAILEADALADEMLSGIGFSGANMGERLSSIQDGQIAALSDLRAGHAMRNRIIQDPAFSLSRDEAETVLSQFRKFFEELELF